MASLVKELKRRNVFRVAVGYLILGWVVLQITDIVAPALHLPEWTMTLVLLLGVIGFPFALFFAWAFELTPEGLKREHEVDRSQSITHHTGRKVDFAIIGLLVVALVFIAWDAYLSGPDDEVPVAEAVGTAVETGQIEPGQATPVSIAVLPFVNMSPDPDQEYFSDGLSEEILNLLAKVPGLKVIARTSSFAFKGKNQDIRTIGQALDVSTVLEGSVRKSGERVRITAQLIEVSSGAHLWSDTFDRTLTDIFAVQDDVAAEILKALQVHVGEAPKRERPTENTQAYAHFLKAKAAAFSGEFDIPVEELLKAIALDPMFAEAHELLAHSIWWQSGGLQDKAEAYRRIRDAAAKALAINPNLQYAQALWVSGGADTEGYSFLKEIEAFERVLLQEPGHVEAARALAWDLAYAGYFQEAAELAERVVERDPLSAAAQLILAHTMVATGRRGEALTAFELSDQFGSSWAKFILGIYHLVNKRDEIAIATIEAYLEEEEADLPATYVSELIIAGREPATGKAYLDQRIPQLVASAPEEASYFTQGSLRLIYLGLGFTDRIFQPDPDDVEIFHGTIFRELHFTADPRYLEVAKAGGLIEIWEQRGPPDHCEKLDGQWVCE
jgi:TolB-like protein